MKRVIAVLSLFAASAAISAVAQDNDWGKGPIKRVLLISVDGMHAVDFENCAKGVSTVNNGEPYCPALAALGKTGVNYVAASTSKPSDSFPGLTAIITGGSPSLPAPARRVRPRPARRQSMKKELTSIRPN